jgi:hypothetical protein
VYGWQPSDSWIDNNIQNHGDLGGVYPDRKYATEGDTPAIFHLIPNGLHDPSIVTQGGWGGRFSATKECGAGAMDPVTGQGTYNQYCMYTDSSTGETISDWKSAIENDFAARMDWSINSSYSKANHHPVAVLNGDKGKSVITINASAGSTVDLSASGSSDPDSNSLSYKWWQFGEADSYSGSVIISNSTSQNATLKVPSDASGKNIHIILEIKDNGSPTLTAYRRLIINVS